MTVISDPRYFLRSTFPADASGVPLEEWDGVGYGEIDKHPPQHIAAHWYHDKLYSHDIEARCFRLTDQGRAAIRGAARRENGA